ncbi:membrane transport protein-domain-containing protein [Vararia minispora EC-137]|uniref:Membrane transport protein-domain-containing protein n=1 Tax=Vararia minispora EC-137 TaxID=1314806 RepID=A0ACB8QVS9_9AGAM|nr:membrane transport protein-domain-containing protein [Vararia minispora EC-137]
MQSPIGPLLQTVFLSILEVFLVAFSGYVLARKGILDRRLQRALNRFNIALFTPSLIASKVAFTLSPAKFKELWIVPLFFCVLTIVSAAVAWAMAAMLKLKKTQMNFAVAAAMFMNSNSLPIALLQAFVVSVPGLNWGEDDTAAAKVGRALTYLTLCSTLGMVFRWSIGVRLLEAHDPAHDSIIARDPAEDTPLLAPEEQTPEPVSSLPTISVQSPYISDDRRSPHLRTPFIYSFPNTPAGSQLALPATDLLAPSYAPSDSGSDDSSILGIRARRRSRTPGALARAWEPVKGAWKRFNTFMTAPLYASAISIIVALWPKLQHMLDVHLTPVKQALTQLGNCSIPITLVVLGAYFYSPKEHESVDGELETAPRPANWWARTQSMLSLRTLYRGEGPRGTPRERKMRVVEGEARTVFVAVVSRMLVVPAMFLPLIAFGASRDVPPVFEDPVFILSLVLLLGSPPAITLSQMTQAVAGDAFERLISRTIFWSYCVVTPPSTVILALIAMLITRT